MALDGQIKVAMYSVLLFITQRLLWPLTELGDTFDLYQRAMASFKRITTLKDTRPTITNGNSELKNYENSIVFNDVNFSYVEGFSVLNNVSVEINKGQTVAIVGSTGSGKSTMIKLILRLYDVTEGDIKFDNINIKDLDLTSLRSNIALVSQDIFLFEGSVFENIAYGNLDASED